MLKVHQNESCHTFQVHNLNNIKAITSIVDANYSGEKTLFSKSKHQKSISSLMNNNFLHTSAF